MSEPEFGLKEYLESRFTGLECYIDVKFKPFETHEGRIKSLENWRAYVLGAAFAAGFLFGMFGGKIL